MTSVHAPTVRWLREADVAALLDLPTAIDALRAMLPLEGTDQASTPPKALAVWGDAHSAHSLVAAIPGSAAASMKSWVNVPAGASAVLTFFDTDTGQLRAVMQAGRLGMIRTAATTGLATFLLSPDDVSSMAIIGAGRQARSQVQAVATVRPLETVHVWNRSSAGAQQLAVDLRRLLPDVDVVLHDSVRAACRDAAVVVTATRATEPFIGPGDLPEVVLVHAMGAILPANAELAPQLISEATRLVVDSPTNVARSSREFAQAIERPPAQVGQIEVLGHLVAEAGPPAAGRTIVKAVGTGLADLAVAKAALDVAESLDVGTVLPA